MATEIQTPTKSGTGTAIPEQEPIKWVNLEEAEKFERMILKNYIRKSDKKDSEKFFYKILGLHPTCPAGVITSTDNFLITFEVQKYHRNKFTKTTVRDSQNPSASNEAQVNLQVDAHEMRGGKWVCIDPQASFFMDAREFKEKFEADNME